MHMQQQVVMLMALLGLLGLLGLASAPQPTDSSSPPVAGPDSGRRGIHWAVGAASDDADFLLGSNSQHWANTSGPVSDITTGILQCCSAVVVNRTGHLLVEYHSQMAPGIFEPYRARGMAVYVDIDPAEGEDEPGTPGPALGLNCSNPPTAAEEELGCVTPGDICNAALARKHAFAAEVLALTIDFDITGVSVDWEYAYGNNQTCFAALWEHVKSVIGPHGKQFAPWVSNGGGWETGPGDADAEWDYWSYLVPAQSAPRISQAQESVATRQLKLILAACVCCMVGSLFGSRSRTS